MTPSRTRIRRMRWALGVGALAVIGVLVWQVQRLPEGTWENWIESVPASTLLIALATLPVVGFPISALHIATGARFGLLLGTVAVAVSTVVHLGGGYLLADWVERPVRRLLAACGWKLRPVNPAAAWPFTLWIALLPGVSYALKNLIPPLAGVSWRVYLTATLPVHVATALVGLSVGHATVRFSWGLAVAVVVYALALILLTRYLARLFRASTASHDGPDRVELSPSRDRSRAAGDLK